MMVQKGKEGPRKKIVAIPERLRCPSCGRRRLRIVDVDAAQKQVGPYLRRCTVTCTCGYSAPASEPFFGVPAE